ncbi:A24 family peptidase [Streptomyces sp. NPDC046859]|uniref:A24 family peptidase n=1 Tax=Streptomyces sp. NPDC046859 TaxID=3155734 RepID=UPI0033F2CB30
MEGFLITVAGVLWGCVTGVLIPRPAYRLSVPVGGCWRSVCPAGHRLVGVGGGWFGRARCSVGDRYGPSSLLVACVTAGVCGLLAAATGARPELVVWLLLAPVCVLLAMVDASAHRLPDVLTLPLAVAACVLLGGASLLPGVGGSWLSTLFGSLLLGACFFVLFLVGGGLGFGDVKLALVLGAVLGWYGWPVVLVGVFAGCLFGALYGIGLLITGRAGARSTIAFGPFLLAGALAGVLLGASLS